MTRVLISGALHRDPEQRTAKTGTAYVVATVRAGSGENVQWWSAIAFAETAQAELLRLLAGDSVCMQGALQVEAYEGRDGATRIALKVIAEHVLALRQPPRSKRKVDKPGEAIERRKLADGDESRQTTMNARHTSPCANAVEPELNDALPF